MIPNLAVAVVAKPRTIAVASNSRPENGHHDENGHEVVVRLPSQELTVLVAPAPDTAQGSA